MRSSQLRSLSELSDSLLHGPQRECCPEAAFARKDELIGYRDGTPAALVPMAVFGVLFFAATLYISLDTALNWTSVFHMSMKNVPDLEATALFVLTLIWPAL